MIPESTRRGERTREEIIAAAHSLFLSNGFHGTSMRRIADQAGIAVGGIYNHFPGKEEIFIAVLQTYHPYHQVVPAMVSAEGNTIEEFIRDAADRLVESLKNQPDFLNLMFIELVEFSGSHLPQLYEEFFPRTAELMQRFLGQSSQLRPIPLPVLVRAFVGLFFSFVITDLLIGRQVQAESSQDAFRHFVDIYLHGILAVD